MFCFRKFTFIAYSNTLPTQCIWRAQRYRVWLECLDADTELIASIFCLSIIACIKFGEHFPTSSSSFESTMVKASREKRKSLKLILPAAVHLLKGRFRRRIFIKRKK